MNVESSLEMLLKSRRCLDMCQINRVLQRPRTPDRQYSPSLPEILEGLLPSLFLSLLCDTDIQIFCIPSTEEFGLCACDSLVDLHLIPQVSRFRLELENTLFPLLHSLVVDELNCPGGSVVHGCPRCLGLV